MGMNRQTSMGGNIATAPQYTQGVIVFVQAQHITTNETVNLGETSPYKVHCHTSDRLVESTQRFHTNNL